MDIDGIPVYQSPAPTYSYPKGIVGIFSAPIVTAAKDKWRAEVTDLPLAPVALVGAKSLKPSMSGRKVQPVTR